MRGRDPPVPLRVTEPLRPPCLFTAPPLFCDGSEVVAAGRRSRPSSEAPVMAAGCIPTRAHSLSLSLSHSFLLFALFMSRRFHRAPLQDTFITLKYTCSGHTRMQSHVHMYTRCTCADTSVNMFVCACVHARLCQPLCLCECVCN